MMMNFDEKQIIDRGKAFQYGFLTAIVTMFLAYLIVGIFDVKITTDTLFIICMWIPFTVCMITLIIKDAYDGINVPQGRGIVTIFGFVGLLLIVTASIGMIRGTKVIIEDGYITDTVSQYFMGSCMLITSIVYWRKQLADSKKYVD